ncbi:pyrroline-5-carboxylate reductase [Rhizobium sp. BK650]|uniref:pyrroline-5-carboxylate reductase n=1 Tax=Rhizobium sp. BK650 TaxID=2586990 RepID=UPI00160717BF|nr:pyrroline-5-carboxylate reductase [Rhizobium sp. BK650]MBB3659808.1 pyrroline-5-carboxylate reductase [Rhizobium sp. BK650]
MTIKDIGFVGTGAISEAMVRGMLAEPAYAKKVYLSPRNAATASRLKAEFDDVEVATGNQAVVDRCDIVVLAIRPQIAREVVSALVFRNGQSVISLVAATERQALLDWIDADVHLVQAIPLPFVSERRGITTIYPPDRGVAALFDTLGGTVQCASKKEYDLLAAASSLMSTYFGVMEITTAWLEENGLERSKAQAFLAPLFESLARRANNGLGIEFADLCGEFATKGGLNEQVLNDFRTKGGQTSLQDALDRVLARIEGRA